MATKYCTGCGEEIKYGAKFCTNCGKQILFLSSDERKGHTLYKEVALYPDEVEVESNPFKYKWLGYYILLNIPLYFLSGGNEQMLGFLFYSLAIIIVFAVRMKKANTFNWLLKGLIGLQFLFVLAIIFSQREFLFEDLISSTAAAVFFLLAMVQLAMLVNGK